MSGKNKIQHGWAIKKYHYLIVLTPINESNNHPITKTIKSTIVNIGMISFIVSVEINENQ